MRRFYFVLILAFILQGAGLENLVSLVLRDSNHDGVYDSSPYYFVLDGEDRVQVAVASEIAYKLGFYSGEYINMLEKGKRRIILRRNRQLPMKVGAVRLEGRDILVEGNDNTGFLAAKEFFDRWPYVWKVEGDDAITWKGLASQWENQLLREGVKIKLYLKGLRIRARTSPLSSTYIKRGEIEEAAFKVKGDFSSLRKFIEKLREARNKGEKPFILNYPYIRKLVFVQKDRRISLDRWGAPEEFFRPSYGEFPPEKKKRAVPSLEDIFASPLALIIEKRAGKGAIAFAFRAGLSATEAHFPFTYLSQKDLPPERTAVVIGKGPLSEEHASSEPSMGLCLEKGKKFWFLSPDCAQEFSENFMFPALRREKNIYYLDFYLHKYLYALPKEAQRALLSEHIARPFVSGETYGKYPVYSKEITDKDEGERLKEALKGVKYTKAVAYLSESPERRKKLERELGGKIKIRSSYKTGFFWIREEVLPKIKGADRVVIHVRKVLPGKGGDIISSPKQFLYELYPVDEVISKELGIPLSRIEFVLEKNGPLYRVEAFRKGRSLGSFLLNPPVIRDPFPRVEGWVTAWRDKYPVLSKRIKTDPEMAWEFYRKKFLPWLWNFIMRKTMGKPTWDKQPFFSFIEVNFQAPEPDFTLGIDREMVSSTEAFHDEIYFFTLYFLSRILKPGEDGGNIRRNLYPGAIIPYIRTGSRGFRFSIRVYDYRKPGLYLRNKQLERFYPEGKIKRELMGWSKNHLWVKFTFEKEEDYKLYARGISRIKKLTFPVNLILTLKFKDNAKNFSLKGIFEKPSCKGEKPDWEKPLSPAQVECLAMNFRFYYPVAESFLGRKIYIVEKLTAKTPRYSPSHFFLKKPTLLLNARQHANEVSSTSYLLEFLNQNPPSKINYVAIPMENPDGAAISLKMMEKESPIHSLHAGRYNALGADVGYHIKKFSPFVPEGFARHVLLKRWKGDIFLNLHGYPSHEWVQQFTGYLPFPYRNYWIPRGHFFYFSSLENPLNPSYSKMSRALMEYLAKTLSADKKIDEFNRRLYQRYYRWAERWNPHAFKMEPVHGYNIYWKSGRKRGLKTPIPISTEVPEYMDETASGKFLSYLIYCGKKFIKAHADFLLSKRKGVKFIFHEKSGEISQMALRPVW